MAALSSTFTDSEVNSVLKMQHVIPQPSVKLDTVTSPYKNSYSAQRIWQPFLAR